MGWLLFSIVDQSMGPSGTTQCDNSAILREPTSGFGVRKECTPWRHATAPTPRAGRTVESNRTTVRPAPPWTADEILGGEALLGEQDVYLFREGTHTRLYESMGCTLGERAAMFRVWAPNASRVGVIGQFNDWDANAHPLTQRADGSGVWEGEVAGVGRGDPYKYRVVSSDGRYEMDKADPFALCAELPPLTASRAWSLDYAWHDADWMATRECA